MLEITMIGAGYVGLVSAACLAELGFGVTCVDVDAGRIASLNTGAMPIYEPGLDRLVQGQAAAGRLRFAGFAGETVAGADVVVLAVGTPSKAGSDEADLGPVYAATRMVAPHLRPGAVVVTKSTVPVGTNRQIRALIQEARPALPFSVASNPEFLREGCAIRDFTHPDRVVIGHHDDAGRAVMEEIYRRFHERGTPLVFTSLENAELIKYAANAFLAMKIAFINEVADLCETVGGDVEDVAGGIGLDPRIGQRFLRAGPGFGGSCFPKDTRALAAMGRRLGKPQRLVETVVKVNEARKRSLFERVTGAIGAPKGRTVAILGVAFKPGTDDVREAPALSLIPALVKAGAKVRYYDPEVSSASPALRDAERAASLADVLDGADAAVLLTEWDEFRGLDLGWARERMAGSVVVDFGNVFDAAEMERADFDYVRVGSGSGRTPGRGAASPDEDAPAGERDGAAHRSAAAGMELADL